MSIKNDTDRTKLPEKVEESSVNPDLV